MRIAMLTDTYKPVLNGVTNSVSLIKRQMEKMGHEVWVVTLGNLTFQDDEPHVVRSPGLPLSDSGYYLPALGINREAAAVLKGMNVLHAHHPFISGAIAVRYGQRYSIPVVFTNHTRYDLYSNIYLPMLPLGLSDVVLETFYPRFGQFCDLIIAPSQGIYDQLRRWGVSRRMEIVHNGIDLTTFSKPIVPVQRAELSIPDDAILSVFVGRMSGEKNVAFLLRAFAPVAREIPHAHLLLVGSGPDLDEYRELVRDLNIAGCTHFTGRVEYERVPAYVKLADLFVTASVTEVHPLTVLEAMAGGLPVLGIRSPGVGDIVQEGVNGSLVDEDRVALALRWARLLLDAEGRKQLAAGALHTSHQYDIQKTAARMLELYSEVARVHARGKE